MTSEFFAAAAVLAETLAEENAALAALDLPRAAAMLPDKQRATDAFVAVQTTHVVGAHRDTAEHLVRRLRSLVTENKALLERAIVVQTRVIGIVARAAAPAITSSGYGTRGRSCHAGRPAAYALSARA